MFVNGWVWSFGETRFTKREPILFNRVFFFKYTLPNYVSLLNAVAFNLKYQSAL